MRSARAARVTVGFEVALVGNTLDPTIQRFGTSCARHCAFRRRYSILNVVTLFGGASACLLWVVAVLTTDLLFMSAAVAFRRRHHFWCCFWVRAIFIRCGVLVQAQRLPAEAEARSATSVCSAMSADSCRSCASDAAEFVWWTRPDRLIGEVSFT